MLTKYTVIAKFHYASLLRTCSEQAPNMFEASSELDSIMEFGYKRLEIAKFHYDI